MSRGGAQARETGIRRDGSPGSADDASLADGGPRERAITPWRAYLIDDRRRQDHQIVVWEIATVQCGLPLGFLTGAIALSWLSTAAPLSTALAAAVMVVCVVGAIVAAHVTGRILWGLGVRPGRGTG